MDEQAKRDQVRRQTKALAGYQCEHLSHGTRCLELGSDVVVIEPRHRYTPANLRWLCKLHGA